MARAGEPRIFSEGRSDGGELKYINDLPVLIVAGTPEEIGRQKAALTGEVVKKIADYPRQLLERANRAGPPGEMPRNVQVPHAPVARRSSGRDAGLRRALGHRQTIRASSATCWSTSIAAASPAPR